MQNKGHSHMCDTTAKRILQSLFKIAHRRVMNDVESIRYTTEQGSIIVCRDGGVLYAQPFVSLQAHKAAFKVGLRSNKKEISQKFSDQTASNKPDQQKPFDNCLKVA